MTNRDRIHRRGSLWLNSVLVNYPSQAMPAAVVPYARERFNEALDRSAGKSLPVRLPDDEMALVPLTDDTVLPGPETWLDTRQNPRLLSTLVREAVFRQLRHIAETRGIYKVVGRKPPTVETLKDFGLVPAHLGLPPWLTKRVVITFETRIVELPGAGPTVVLTCVQRLRTIIGANCEELTAAGVGLIGSYVSQWAARPDPALDDRLEIAGRVVSVEGGVLTLADHAGGPDRIPATEAFLEPTRANFDSVVEELTQRRAERIIAEITRREADWRWGEVVQKRVERAFDFIRGAELWLARGVPLELGPLLGEGAPFPSAHQFPKPILSFDPGGRHSDAWAQRTLDKVGPYDRQTFEAKRLRIAVVCEASQRGRTSEVVAAFLEGMPDVRSSKGLVPHETGLVGRFRLQQASVEFFEVSAATGEAYADAARRAMSMAAERDQPWDLGILQVRREWKELPEASSPYWMAKATFLKRDVPTQALATEMMHLSAFEQACALANASLATYAKLGGKPWLLRTKGSTDHELVFGLGSSTRKTGRKGAGERVVGITTVFSSEGNYLLDAHTGAVPFQEYPACLTEVLRKAVTRVRDENAWRPRDSVRLVFHAFTQVRRETAEAVAQAVQDLGLDRVTFAFLHVAEDHPWTLLDLSARSGKCAFGPERGQAIELGEREWLVSLTGRQQVKADGQGIPAPVLLRLHGDSTFKDMLYLSRQVSDFACHSWRTFGPSRAPITLLYADEIAKQLAGLEQTAAWDRDAVTGRIMRKPWFL
ncbi:argonaute/piwi family protein [Roseomonas populi]|uniref:Protein argonaute n=1 Tax=Roseomonas populi TaxID=3121582 RepID=A0ABT1X4U6_9PROT|nr:hypothetical protein [Roseomonas pecuniae]MCR0983136.1 hypothetical protein [Roseomonas pecuniae]